METEEDILAWQRLSDAHYARSRHQIQEMQDSPIARLIYERLSDEYVKIHRRQFGEDQPVPKNDKK